MSQEGKTIHPVTRAILALVALLIIVVAGNMLVSSLGIGHKTLDLTEDKVHSLSHGTESILDQLAAPVVIRYYATRSTDYMPEDLKLHMRRVDDLLAEYQSLSKGKLRVEQLDPEPDTDAEDSANLDGISGQSINGENLYFGLAITCLDRSSTLPFLDPRDETMLEYEVSRAIAEVSATRKPLIGYMSALPIGGAPATMPGQPAPRPWIVLSQLQKSYQVEDLSMTPDVIDPEKYNIVLLIHPAGITPEAEFALDQYILQGGTVIACVDPFSLAAQMSSGGNPMMGQQGTPTFSSLPTLFKSWGLEMPTNQVVGDGKYQTEMRGGRPALAVLSIPQDGMPQKDSVVTKELTSVTFYLAGGITRTGGSGISIDTLVKASSQAGLIDNLPASRLDPSLVTQFRPNNDVSYDLVLHLKGNFTSAFPDGKPGDKPGDTTEETEDDERTPPAEALSKATKGGNVILISDVDAFYDQFAYSLQPLGNVQIASPVNGNSSLLLNLVDQAASSTHLIGSRSRAATSRPFIKLQEMESDFNQRIGVELDTKQAELDQINREINELVTQRRQGDRVYLDADLESKIREGETKRVSARKELREMEKDLRRKKDALAGKVIIYNIAAVPLIVILVGLTLFAIRRSKTRAR